MVYNGLTSIVGGAGGLVLDMGGILDDARGDGCDSACLIGL